MWVCEKIAQKPFLSKLCNTKPYIIIRVIIAIFSGENISKIKTLDPGNISKIITLVPGNISKIITLVPGNLENWWMPETEAMYRKKAQCMIDQYGNFTHPQIGLNLNGFITQGENIADNGGIKESYKGYRECKSLSRQVILLGPSLYFTFNCAQILNQKTAYVRMYVHLPTYLHECKICLSVTQCIG
jgi:hypothetical protein